VKKLFLALIILFVFSCGSGGDDVSTGGDAQLWKLTGTVYVDTVPTEGVRVKWEYGKFLQTQFEIDWTPATIQTDAEGKYYAQHRTSESSFNILNYRVSAEDPFILSWTNPELRRNIIMGGVTKTHDFYFTSDQ